MEKLRILVVDDMASVRNIVKHGLERSFFNVEIDESANGKEAQTKLENSHYDLIICDWEMPLLKGDELLNWVRSHPTLNTTPFVMLTAKSEKEHVLRAIQAGVTGYIIKPFTIDGLVQKITAVIDKFDRRQFERYNANDSITFRFQGHTAKGNLIDISLGGNLSVFSVKNPLPRILEKVFIDIDPKNNPKIAEMQGFVIRIQAAEAFIDSPYVKIAVKFLDLASDKRSELTDFINKLKNTS
jgi:CheY-like chemotaxis protein